MSCYCHCDIIGVIIIQQCFATKRPENTRYKVGFVNVNYAQFIAHENTTGVPNQSEIMTRKTTRIMLLINTCYMLILAVIAQLDERHAVKLARSALSESCIRAEVP